MPHPPDTPLPPAQVLECLSQMRRDLLQDFKNVMQVSQKETLDQQRFLINCQEANMKKMMNQVLQQNCVPVLESTLSPEQVPEQVELKTPIQNQQVVTGMIEETTDLAVGETAEEQLIEGMSCSGIRGRGECWVGAEDRTTNVVAAFDPDVLLAQTGLFALTVRSHWFHALSTGMICTNAIYLGVEADWNTSSSLMTSSWEFQFCEHLFTTFFFAELILRFGAFEDKRLWYKDHWFILDFFMVVLMVIETWLVPVVLLVAEMGEPKTGPAGGVGRLLRLFRLVRFTKLMQKMPELVTMVKGMVAAIRATQAALLILILLVYVFAIIMNQTLSAEPDVDMYFGTVRDAMVTLLVQGVLLDDISGLVRELIGVHSIIGIVVFAVFVLLSALTVMNMLIGVLCEVVLDVSADEKENLVKAQMRKTLLVMLEELDADHSGMLSKDEVQSVIRHPEAVAIMNDIQVDTTHLLDVTEMLFPTEDSSLAISVFMNIVLTLRGKRSPTMGDMAKAHNMSMWALETQLAEHRDMMKQQTMEELAAHRELMKQQMRF
jgi:hypothetical protein